MKIHNPLTLVIFGVTGELYQNKLSSALFNLFSDGKLPEDFSLIGFARKPLTDLKFRDLTRKAIARKDKGYNKVKLKKFLSRLGYMQGDLENLASFKNLSKKLAIKDGQKGRCSNKLFYLAVPPFLYASILKNLSRSGLNLPCAPGSKKNGKPWSRFFVEKPFGRNIQEAKKLNLMLLKNFDQPQIFRVDHYVMKETMQDLFNLRFVDRRLETLWNNKNIKKVRIVFHEKDTPEDTLERRGEFYDKVGALSDVGQSHMMQMLALVAMEKSKSMNATDIQNTRGQVLEKISLFHKNKNLLLRGQYSGYLKESGVKPNSRIETFFRIILGVNTKRWLGVPFEMESGKALNKEEMSIELCFKNIDARLKFFISSYNNRTSRRAHEKVFYYGILGKQEFFVSSKEAIAQWKLVTDIIKKWQTLPLTIYPRGSKGEDIK